MSRAFRAMPSSVPLLCLRQSAGFRQIRLRQTAKPESQDVTQRVRSRATSLQAASSAFEAVLVRAAFAFFITRRNSP